MAADVATTLAGWSSTSSSNAPAGTTSVSTNADDNLREIQGVIVRGLSHKGADIASATTTDIGAVEGLSHDITGTTTITGFGTVRAGIWKVLVYEGVLTLTHNATSLILLGGASRTTAAGDIQVVHSEGSGNWREWAYQRVSGYPLKGGVYGSSQVFSSSGTWTKPAGLTRVKVTVVGGGAAGGGSAVTGAAEASIGAGGGAGGAAIKTIAAASLGATETVTVGAGGAGASGTTGASGGTSSFGAHCSATGGAGGTTGAAGGSSVVAGASGGVGSSGDFNIGGGPGNGALGSIGGSVILSGQGGSSIFGGGGVANRESNGGAAALNYGSGGGGAAAGSNVAAQTGGAGSAGIVIVEEFF